MISIIIPTQNHSRQILFLLGYLRRIPFAEQISEIIISDGNSDDRTIEVAESYDGVKIIRNDSAKMEAQMNAGARIATGEIICFLHPDSQPPRDFVYEIMNHVEDGHKSGCFRVQFDHTHWLLRVKAWFTRFNLSVFRSGDQTLFVKRTLFNALGGFKEDHVLGVHELIDRIKEAGSFVVIPRYITSSAKKYVENGVYRLEWAHIYLFTLYRFGVPQSHIHRAYQHLMSA